MLREGEQGREQRGEKVAGLVCNRPRSRPEQGQPQSSAAIPTASHTRAHGTPAAKRGLDCASPPRLLARSSTQASPRLVGRQAQPRSRTTGTTRRAQLATVRPPPSFLPPARHGRPLHDRLPLWLALAGPSLRRAQQVPESTRRARRLDGRRRPPSPRGRHHPQRAHPRHPAGQPTMGQEDARHAGRHLRARGLVRRPLVHPEQLRPGPVARTSPPRTAKAPHGVDQPHPLVAPPVPRVDQLHPASLAAPPTADPTAVRPCALGPGRGQRRRLRHDPGRGRRRFGRRRRAALPFPCRDGPPLVAPGHAADDPLLAVGPHLLDGRPRVRALPAARRLARQPGPAARQPGGEHVPAARGGAQGRGVQQGPVRGERDGRQGRDAVGGGQALARGRDARGRRVSGASEGGSRSRGLSLAGQ